MSEPDWTAVRLVVFDVDGVFTDGTFLLDEDGRESKRFSTQDGYGVRRLLAGGVAVAIVTGRSSGAVVRRMDELGVEHVMQGVRDKLPALNKICEALGIAPSDSAYVGDDLPDLPAMRAVRLPIAVANAVAEVRSAAAFVTSARGGDGAVREIADRLLDARADT